MEDVNIFDLVKNDFNNLFDQDLVGKRERKMINKEDFTTFLDKDIHFVKKR